MILALIISLLILILLIPINVTGLLYYKNDRKKLFFAVLLFGKFNIVSGYVTKREKGGFYLHLKNKAIIIEMNSENLLNGDLNLHKYVTVTLFNGFITVGANSLNKVFACYGIVSAIKNFFIAKSDNEYLYSIDLNVNLDDLEVFETGVKIKILFSIIRILSGLIANYIDKGIKYAKKLKKQNR